MSILIYAVETSTHRSSVKEGAAPANAASEALKKMAGLVPAEALMVHAAALSALTKPGVDSRTLEFKDQVQPWLSGSLCFLLGLCVLLYAVARLRSEAPWTRRDWARMLVAPLALSAWILLEPFTLFNGLAISAKLDGGERLGVGLAIAAVATVVSQLVENEQQLQNRANSQSQSSRVATG